MEDILGVREMAMLAIFETESHPLPWPHRGGHREMDRSHGAALSGMRDYCVGRREGDGCQP
jgi:hypothetical protein